MNSFLSSLAKIFKRGKKRHNSESDLSELGKKLSRAEFLRIYESMPERARAQLFASLEQAQKQKLLRLLSEDTPTAQENIAPSDLPWQAEDFLPEKDERKIARLRHVRELRQIRRQFADLLQYPPESLAEVLSQESSSLIAVVLLQLEKKFASQVLKVMPELMRGEIVRAMAEERKISGEALIAIGKKIADKLSAMPHRQMGRQDNIKHVNDILKLMGADEAQRITKELSETDTALAKKLELTRYTFEDLFALNARDFRTLFSALPDENLWARALKATDQAERKKLLGKLPLKRAGLIAEAMANVRTTRLDSIDKARSKILKVAFELAAKHKISFANNGLH